MGKRNFSRNPEIDLLARSKRELKIRRPANGTLKDRLECLLDDAAHVFLEYGYGLTSLDIIAHEARVAKRTIYQYFGDKAELFGAVTRRLDDTVLLLLPQLETDHRPIAQVLTDFANQLLNMVLSPEGIRLYRIVVGEAGRFPELAKQFYQNAPAHVLSCLTHYLERQTELGYLHPIDASVAAEQFQNMILGETHRRVLLRIDQSPDPPQIRQRVEHAVTLFIHGYLLNGCPP